MNTAFCHYQNQIASTQALTDLALKLNVALKDSPLPKYQIKALRLASVQDLPQMLSELVLTPPPLEAPKGRMFTPKQLLRVIEKAQMASDIALVLGAWEYHAVTVRTFTSDWDVTPRDVVARHLGLSLRPSTTV